MDILLYCLGGLGLAIAFLLVLRMIGLWVKAMGDPNDGPEAFVRSYDRPHARRR